ncbi:MAG: thiolase family protein [Nitrososphaerota archaeon]|jgi:acetyl-CoA acetyltransferase|nr:thiolase family protein [Nitrososphaerota archaeon]MDG6966337.1 thiolase family protein [Nitrososphaerota archaeon]MDG6977772.1 thiolase family protein [Nitrososphaerota archaeon]MDG7021988.1 thiolase family protein [Nitrososphaerota archaeon]
MEYNTSVASYAETPLSRGRKERGEFILTAEQCLSWAARLTLEKVGLGIRDLSGQGLAVAGPLVRISELWTGEIAEILGVSPKLLIRSDHGGASAPNLVLQASLLIKSGLVDMVLCVGGGARNWSEARTVSPHQYGIDFEKPYGMDGPNTKFALVAQRHFHQYGTRPEHFAKLAITQRKHASLNPNAYLRNPISEKDYMESPMICSPLRMLDCSIAVDGAAGFLLVSKEKARRLADNAASVSGCGTISNYREGGDASPDFTVTGVKAAAKTAFDQAGLTISDLSLVHCYDDYNIMTLIQLEDIGLCKKGDGGKFIEKTDLSYQGDLPLNTSGGLLSYGQMPGAGSFTGVIEVARQLAGEAGARQVDECRTGLMTSFGGLGYDLHVINAAAVLLTNEE